MPAVLLKIKCPVHSIPSNGRVDWFDEVHAREIKDEWHRNQTDKAFHLGASDIVFFWIVRKG